MEFPPGKYEALCRTQTTLLNNGKPPRLSVNCVTACGDTVGKWRLVGVPRQTTWYEEGRWSLDASTCLCESADLTATCSYGAK